MTRDHSARVSKINAQAAGVRLPVLVRIGRKDREIGRLQPDEDAIVQCEEDTSTGPGDVEVLATQDERIGVRQDAEPPREEPEERTDGPRWGKVDRNPTAVEQLRTVVGQTVADVPFEADRLVQD